MALIDDPRAWILKLFEMEEREREGSGCALSPGGVCPAGLPLEDGERVSGFYKGKYHFAPTSLIILERGVSTRIPWSSIRSCSSRHGEGKTFSDLTLTDGRTLRVRVGDMATGWVGRISQIYHQLIEHHGHRAAMGRPLMLASEFFQAVTDDYSFAPNLERHPTLKSFRDAVSDLERSQSGTRVFMDLVEDDEDVIAQGIVIVSPGPAHRFRQFAACFGAVGVIPADENTIRRVGLVPEGLNVWLLPWD